MVIGYMKYSKYIITIETLCDFHIPDGNGNSTIAIDHFKIISIEDVTGKSYDCYYENGFQIKKKNQIIKRDTVRSYSFFLDKNSAYYYQFFENQQWRLFEFGFSQFCNFNLGEWTTNVFLDNGKVIGDFILYFKDILRLKVNFDKIDSGEIQFTYFNQDGSIEKIENKNKDQMIEEYNSCFRGGILDLIMSLEYFV